MLYSAKNYESKKTTGYRYFPLRDETFFLSMCQKIARMRVKMKH
jgi:hypothetical protein